MTHAWYKLAETLPPGRPVLIAGPTASGKSALALAVAEVGGGVIVNADALQVFGCWRILTARPTPADEARAPHLLYGHIPFDADYSVGHWLREVAPLLRDGPRPIIVGGTGLYFTALTTGLAEIPPVPAAIRQAAEARLRDTDLTTMATDLDPATAARIDLKNPARVQRAWEVLRATGRGLADWQEDTGPPLLPLEQAAALVVSPDRDALAARIDARLDAMIGAGALDEVRTALPRWDATRPAARAIGAPELVAHLRGETDLGHAIAAAKAATRQYAKRQRTWLRSKMGAWRWLAV
jgi:tRNA dimethylallyltransferase